MGRINVTSLIFEGLSEPQQYSLEGASGLSNSARGHIRAHDFQAASLVHAFGIVEKGCWAFRGLYLNAVLQQRLKNSSLCGGCAVVTTANYLQ